MSDPAPIATYLELRESAPDGSEGAGLSHSGEGLVLLHVLELAAYGEPTGVLTIVHGAGDHGGRYVEAGRRLSREAWAVALPDLRGHGRSEGQRGHSAGIREVVRDLDSVQDHLAYRLPDAPKLMLAQGLGALWALAYAVEKPGRLAGLVLLSPLWEPRFEIPPPPAGLKKLFAKYGPQTEGRIGLDPARTFTDAAAAAAWSSDELVHDAITVRAAEQAAEAARTYPARMGETGVPILVVHGSADPLTPPERSRAFEGQGIEVAVVEGGGHDLLHGPGADELLDRIAAWLKAR